MQKSARAKWEEKFGKLSELDKSVAKIREKDEQAVKKKTARLRALRLAKEAEDRETATANKQAKADAAAKRKAAK